MSFQELITALNTFWAKQGCLIGQPYGVEVGAGTGNPHTFFRVLGPEPYNVAYVEPSRRPTDGRYGKSPNRFQHYYQYQVILKPAPKFNQELFIESLIALGLDPRKHDIRFVEDNWESTPLGAWGLGWEIWCDGMEIAQYTYFQQMAGTPIEVPTLEITYGLERLAMYLQDVDHYKDLKWNDTTTYADIFERHEFWQATHNFETSTPDSLKALYAIYENEVQKQLEQKNFWAAYDYQLKVSHLFNLLDARGMVSVSDRMAKFGQMSKSAKAISTMYLEERATLGYPLMNRVQPITYKPKMNETVGAHKKGKYQKNIAVVELGFEELPASYLEEWSNILTHTWFKQQLKSYGVSYRKAYLYLTPRRIVLKVVSPSKQGRVVKRIKGPIASIAYDGQGKPTQVLEGFVKKNELSLKNVKIIEENGKSIISAEKEMQFSLSDVFQSIVNDIIGTAPKTKWMVWEAGVPAFIRPLRWILALHNDKKIALQIWNVTSGKTTQLPRYEIPAEEKIQSAQQYFQFIRNNGILLSPKKRMRRISKEGFKHGQKIGNFEKIVAKNAFLTESPHAAGIVLDAQYQVLPTELITLILEKNQMYLMTQEKTHVWYHVVANHRRVHKRIAYGNQKVAKARLDDGLFYFQQDAKQKLSDYDQALSHIAFHPKAGSYQDKKRRIGEILTRLYKARQQPVPTQVQRALTLIKNDKASLLGKEFPSLEGVIGKAYALRDGVDGATAELLAAHYLPLEPNGAVPSTIDAQLLSLADKLDSLLTLAQVEKLPEGNHDPFEIRKTVYRLLTLLVHMPGTTISEFIAASELSPELKQSLTKYINTRFEIMLQDAGIPQWIAHNVALATSNDYAQKFAYAKKLSTLVTNDSEREELSDTFKRVINILQKNGVDSSHTAISELLSQKGIEQPEQELLQFVSKKNSIFLPEDLKQLSTLLSHYFEKVTVIAEQKEIRNRRLNTLALVKEAIQKFFAIAFT